MKIDALLKLSVMTTEEAEEAVVELLARIFQVQPSVYCDWERGNTVVTVHLEKKRQLSGRERDELRLGLAKIRQSGLGLGSGRVSLKRLRPENWAESWKGHFKPLEVGGKLLVKPSWSRRRAKAGQATVVLDPGLSFGTGQHATTKFCLTELARHHEPRVAQSFLDAGTGSGILAIAAAKLGYKPIVALDYDPQAVAVARANARRNGVGELIRCHREDIMKPGGRASRTYDFICANLIANVLVEARDWLVKRLSPGGVLVVAGILREEFERIRAEYEAVGLRLLGSRGEKEWRSGSFMAPKMLCSKNVVKHAVKTGRDRRSKTNGHPKVTNK